MNTAIYVRVSTADQRPDSQVQELTAYCPAAAVKIPRHLFRHGIRFQGFPATTRRATALWTGFSATSYKLDRLGRFLTHMALLLDEFARNRVPLMICTSQSIDTSDDNPAGRLQLGVLMAVAEFERSLIREKAGQKVLQANQPMPQLD